MLNRDDVDEELQRGFGASPSTESSRCCEPAATPPK